MVAEEGSQKPRVVSATAAQIIARERLGDEPWIVANLFGQVTEEQLGELDERDLIRAVKLCIEPIAETQEGPEGRRAPGIAVSRG